MNEEGGALPDVYFLRKKAWVTLAAPVAFLFSNDCTQCLVAMLTLPSPWMGIVGSSPRISALLENLDEQAFANNQSHFKCISSFIFQTFINRGFVFPLRTLRKPWCFSAVGLVSSSWAWANHNILLLYRKIKIEHIICMILCSSYKVLFLDRWRFAVRKLKRHQPCMHPPSRLAGRY